MNRDDLDEWADDHTQALQDDRLCSGVCIGCAGPMPARLSETIPLPVRCPKCRPQRWEEYYQQVEIQNATNTPS